MQHATWFKLAPGIADLDFARRFSLVQPLLQHSTRAEQDRIWRWDLRYCRWRRSHSAVGPTGAVEHDEAVTSRIASLRTDQSLIPHRISKRVNPVEQLGGAHHDWFNE